MGFNVTNGIWKNPKTLIPKNEEEKYYAVTLELKRNYFRTVADEHFRYFNDRWELYRDGEWHPLANDNWELVAYTEIKKLEPCALCGSDEE